MSKTELLTTLMLTSPELLTVTNSRQSSSNGATELSLTVLLQVMDGELEGVDEIFNTHKTKLEEAKTKSADESP